MHVPKTVRENIYSEGLNRQRNSDVSALEMFSQTLVTVEEN